MMTVLSYRATPYTLSEASEDIGEIYSAVADGLPNIGFSGVKNEPGHVFAVNGDALVDVIFLYNSGRSFWQVVICAGDVQATNDQLLGQVQTLIANIKTL
jgi:hypothetical protein